MTGVMHVRPVQTRRKLGKAKPLFLKFSPKTYCTLFGDERDLNVMNRAKGRNTHVSETRRAPAPFSSTHASKLHSVALIYILFSTCIRGTLARIQIPYRHRHPSPTCLVRMAPTITDGSSVSSYIFNYPAQHTIIQLLVHH